MTQNDTVTVTRAPLRLPTYPVGEPERNPLFFEKRVYQGSCGKVYPVPFVDKVGDRARKRAYDAVTLENAWVRVTVLPELGKFVGCRLGSGAMETAIIFVTVDLLRWNGNWVKLVASVLVVIANYAASKWLVFRKKQ